MRTRKATDPDRALGADSILGPAVDGGGRPEPRRSRARTEAAIYRIAAHKFADNGYASTTLQDIADEVGIHKSTIFHYVENKEELLAIVLDRSLRRPSASLKSIAADPDATALQRLIAAVRTHIEFVLDHPDEVKVFLRERKHLSGERGSRYLAASQQYQKTFERLVREGIGAGELRPGNPKLKTLFLLGAANWMVEWYRPAGAFSREEIIEHFVDAAVLGMLAA